MKFDVAEALELAEKELGTYGDVEILVRRSGLYMIEVRLTVLPRRREHPLSPRTYSSCYISDTRYTPIIPPLKYRFEMLVASLVLHIERASCST